MLTRLRLEFCRWFRPGIDAVLGRNIPWNLRWRLLLLQPINFLTVSIHTFPYIFSRPFRVESITVDNGQTFRTLVYKDNDPRHDRPGKLRPLHLDFHGGSFLGGQPDEGAPFCARVAKETGAVVISSTYRFAPRFTFPVAIDDTDAVVRYVQANAAERWGADPELMTVSGWSAGGNLAMGATQQPNCHAPSPTAFKGAVLFYAAVCDTDPLFFVFF